jgi:hypothetical protein
MLTGFFFLGLRLWQRDERPPFLSDRHSLLLSDRLLLMLVIARLVRLLFPLGCVLELFLLLTLDQGILLLAVVVGLRYFVFGAELIDRCEDLLLNLFFLQLVQFITRTALVMTVLAFAWISPTVCICLRKGCITHRLTKLVYILECLYARLVRLVA